MNYEAACAACYTKGLAQAAALRPYGPRQERPEVKRHLESLPGLEAGIWGNFRHILLLAGAGTWGLSWILSCFLVLH